MSPKDTTVLEVTRYMAESRARIEAVLDMLLPPAASPPQVLHRAMREGVFAGGKRLRPILCLASAQAVGGDGEDALMPAAAVECLHTHTLIHDDLPCMDDDDLRRGRPALHKVFGEATAILAGDSLLALAFELLAATPAAGRLVLELARAAGSAGLAGGQFEDLAAEGQPPALDRLEVIYERKTGRLISAACRLGGLAGGGTEAELEALGRYGSHIGVAFQIVDDLLNATSTRETLGKATGTDAARGKMTYLAFAGMEAARRQARSLADAAIADLDGLSGSTNALVAIADYVVGRAT